ncbi:hypothetical protein [Martelella radicis]|uniref:Uncharacterized protein n=1 Tax=Martelella radicis TaxID=1397476 RepID=A0A7W6KMD9_9HYPH|nr:hypothetical protein [Martelella radicis]MBB4123989.1 hypothetical protein [Martelella radicis]
MSVQSGALSAADRRKTWRAPFRASVLKPMMKAAERILAPSDFVSNGYRLQEEIALKGVGPQALPYPGEGGFRYRTVPGRKYRLQPALIQENAGLFMVFLPSYCFFLGLKWRMPCR